MLTRLPNIDETLQERLEKAMERYDLAKGEYLRVLRDLEAYGISWDDFTDLTGESVTELKGRLSELRRVEKVCATFDALQ
jgi:hypothetical protein